MFESIYKGKLKDFKNIHLDQSVVDQFNYSKDLNKDNFDYISNYVDPTISLEQFDTNLQDDWFTAAEYDINVLIKYINESDNYSGIVIDKDKKLNKHFKELNKNLYIIRKLKTN